MLGRTIAAEALSGSGLGSLASEIRGPRPAATGAAADTRAEPRIAAPARDRGSRATRP
jgi:hypothetical protein